MRVEPAKLLGIAVALGTSALVFSSQIHVGYTSADFWRFLLRSTALYDRVPALATLNGMIAAGVRNGTLGPLSRIPLSFWLWDLPPYAERFAHVLGIIATLTTLYLLVYRLTGSNGPSIVAVTAILCGIEYRVPDDPFLSNVIVAPYTCEIVLCGLLLYLYVPSGWLAVALSALLCGSAVATIPDAALPGASIIALPWLTRSRNALVSSLVFAAVIAGAVFLACDGHLSLAPFGIVAGNLLSPLPLVHRMLHAEVPTIVSATQRNKTYDVVPGMTAAGWSAAFLAGIALLAVSLRRGRATGFIECVVLGAMFWASGALFSSGGGYFEAIGFGLVCAGLFALVRARKPRMLANACAPLALAVFLVMYGNARSNALVLERSSLPWNAVSIDREAARAGLFDLVGAGSSLSFSPQSPAISLLSKPDQEARLLFWISGKRYIARKRTGGWLLRETFYRDPATSDKTELFRLFSLSPTFTTIRADKYAVFSTPEHALKFEQSLSADTHGMLVRTRIEGNAVLVDARRVCGPVLLANAFLPDGPLYEWSSGFYPIVAQNPIAFYSVGGMVSSLRPGGNPPWRYARQTSVMTIRPGRCAVRKARLNLILFSGFPGQVSISDGRMTRRFFVSEKGTIISFPLQFDGRAVPLTFRTTAPRATLDTTVLRYEDLPILDVHLLVDVVSITVTQSRKLH